MTEPLAILFDFVNAESANQAFSLLQELGYDPALHTPTRLHIHVVGEDLTSALEIVQVHGGTLVEQAAMKDELLASTAYGLDDVRIPAHLVNEDWVAEEEELPGIGEVSSFSARE
ncbi:hypothetical protein J40TS1_14320 [Paenibacillus montaniterrae]|uniref:Uncharacterized protein n=1 Tax=Paenibacillus montaniterrae TaxID=429341 RepID=A0A919YM67_9BACL|nr:hypothetical protein [Paenibacillus montaniterrae]GIP15790.1 hypothetical protein J40TS1_14320 [Paenibacillus montaniterrae]